MTYSLHKPSLGGVLSISTTYLDQNTPYTRYYFGLFCIFISPRRAILYWSDMTVLVTSVDLFCTHTSSWWPIPYIRKFLKAYSVYKAPHVDLKYHIFLPSFSHWEILRPFVYLLLLGELIFIWVTLLTCFFGDLFYTLRGIHGKVFEVFMCTHTSPCLTYPPTSTISSWPSLNTCDFYALFSLFSPWWA